ncbi:hypothetical protein KCP74_06140 [Salmonella enterica subsp. enterica]|nr:hypothetical protein KCP74_06140 [Salmonella enterica subsp. enterica]
MVGWGDVTNAERVVAGDWAGALHQLRDALGRGSVRRRTAVCSIIAVVSGAALPVRAATTAVIAQIQRFAAGELLGAGQERRI